MSARCCTALALAAFTHVGAVEASTLPPITSVPEALIQLRTDQKAAAIDNLIKACRGRFRRDLRDRDEIKKELIAIFKPGSEELKQKVLDTSPCFSPLVFAPIVEGALIDPSEGVVAYAAEVASHQADARFVGPMLDAFDRRAERCLDPAL